MHHSIVLNSSFLAELIPHNQRMRDWGAGSILVVSLTTLG